MTAILWAFVAARSSPPSPGTAAPEAPRAASPQAKAAPEPLHMEDGACVGEPPAPICEPVHLSTPKPVANPRACDTRDDCLPTEILRCRRLQDPRRRARHPLCQRAWLEGPLCDEEKRWLRVGGTTTTTPTKTVVSLLGSDTATRGAVWWTMSSAP